MNYSKSALGGLGSTGKTESSQGIKRKVFQSLAGSLSELDDLRRRFIYEGKRKKSADVEKIARSIQSLLNKVDDL